MADGGVLRRTPLHAEHVATGAKLVPFAGWEMPLQYEGIVAEHMAVRERAGLFDVSHMGQLAVDGTAAIDRAQAWLSNDLSRIPDQGQAQYSLLLNAEGGIEDDLIAYRLRDDELLLVVNAARVEHDVALLEDVAADVSDRWAMFALQGPVALDVLADRLGCDLHEVAPFDSRPVAFDGESLLAATTGYTGERGCELLVPAGLAVDVWRMLAADERVSPCGLGARDTLRLEACYPLHGNDIGPDRDPIGAGLGFAAPAGLHASIDRIRRDGPRQRLVPVAVTGRGIPRPGMELMCPGGSVVGTVTSGTMSPVLRRGIGLAWVDAEHAATGTHLTLDVRGTMADAEVVRRPFVRGSLFAAT